MGSIRWPYRGVQQVLPELGQHRKRLCYQRVQCLLLLPGESDTNARPQRGFSGNVACELAASLKAFCKEPHGNERAHGSVLIPGSHVCHDARKEPVQFTHAVRGARAAAPAEGNAPRPSVRKVGICDRRQRQPHLRAAPHLLSQCASAVRRGTIVRTCAPNQRRRHDQRLQQIVPHQRLFFCGQRTHGALSEARGRRAARPRTVAEELRTLRVAGESAPLAAHQVLEVDGAGLPDARIERCAAPARQRGGGARGARRGA